MPRLFHHSWPGHAESRRPSRSDAGDARHFKRVVRLIVPANRLIARPASRQIVRGTVDGLDRQSAASHIYFFFEKELFSCQIVFQAFNGDDPRQGVDLHWSSAVANVRFPMGQHPRPDGPIAPDSEAVTPTQAAVTKVPVNPTTATGSVAWLSYRRPPRQSDCRPSPTPFHQA